MQHFRSACRFQNNNSNTSRCCKAQCPQHSTAPPSVDSASQKSAGKMSLLLLVLTAPTDAPPPSCSSATAAPRTAPQEQTGRLPGIQPGSPMTTQQQHQQQIYKGHQTLQQQQHLLHKPHQASCPLLQPAPRSQLQPSGRRVLPAGHSRRSAAGHGFTAAAWWLLLNNAFH